MQQDDKNDVLMRVPLTGANKKTKIIKLRVFMSRHVFLSQKFFKSSAANISYNILVFLHGHHECPLELHHDCLQDFYHQDIQ